MCEFPEYDVNEIVPGLWLGNIKSAYDKTFLNNYSIKHILTLYEAFDNNYKYSNINYLTIPIRDKQMCNGNVNMNEFFDKMSEFIYKALKNKESVLVHCKKGHHRSAAVVAAFLIKYYKFDYLTATKYINKLRPCALRRDKCMSHDLFKYNLHLKNIKGCNMHCQKYDRSHEPNSMKGMNRYSCHCK